MDYHGKVYFFELQLGENNSRKCRGADVHSGQQELMGDAIKIFCKYLITTGDRPYNYSIQEHGEKAH